MRAAVGAHIRMFDLRVLEPATYFWRAQHLIAEQTGTGGEAVHKHPGQAEPVEPDPHALADLERAPLSVAAREELRRRMEAGEEIYPYASGGPDGTWNVWLTENPGRIRLEVWEAIVGYWHARAAGRNEGNHSMLIARYGLQGPPAQRRAAEHLGEVAKRCGEFPDHAQQIVLYAYHEADSYLQAHAPDDDEA